MNTPPAGAEYTLSWWDPGQPKRYVAPGSTTDPARAAEWLVVADQFHARARLLAAWRDDTGSWHRTEYTADQITNGEWKRS